MMEAMAACIACTEREAATGNLCEPCASRLVRDHELFPEQLLAPRPGATDGVLVDQWGRVHVLGPVALLGRDPETCHVAVLQSSISRRHAELKRDSDSGLWVVRDLDSTNGTFVNDDRVETLLPLSSGARLRIGDVSFYFVEAEGLVSSGTKPVFKSTIPRPAVDHPDALREVPMRLVEPTGGGGGLVDVAGITVQLTATQFEFVRVLANRMLAESDQPDPVRGFVRTSELAAELPWETAHPQDNHVKQLVRRVRKALRRAGVQSLIESRHRFGYRLKAIPVMLDP